jgi:hypothetical protein
MSESEPAFVFAIISEAESDQQLTRGLAERIFVEQIDWLEFENLTALAHWRGFDEGNVYLSWSGIERLAKRSQVVIHGRYTGAFDERRARLALLLFNSLERPPDAVVFVRDTDNVAERVPSLERARESPWPFAVVLATPHTKRECWILNGFDPRSAAEEVALERVRRKLGFDPRLFADRLTAKGKKGKNNAKVVLEQGLGVEPGSAREVACWQETDLDVLRERGIETRLTAYLQEVVARLVPILAGPSHGK